MKAYKVAIPQDITPAGKNYLIERGYELVIGSGDTSPEAMKSLVCDADAILARTAPYPKEILQEAKQLKVIGRHGIGVDNIDVEYCSAHGIWVTYAPTSNAVSVAEHTLGFMLSLAHHFPYFDKAVREGEWNVRNIRKGIDLEKKKVGIIGLGRIGRLVARKCREGMDMEVLGYDVMLQPDSYPDGIMPSSIEEIFKTADFITLHVPSTSETRGMVNEQLLEKMKPTACLINCGRGDLIDEAALYQALKNKKIAGAALDVFAEEPPKKNNPLFELDNIVLTPHSAALTQESMDRMGLHAAMGIHSVLTGEVPEWSLNHPVSV